MSRQTFIYRDSRGNITAREVENVSETSEYLQGICLNAGELRTFRKDRILEHLTPQANVDQRLAYHRENAPPPRPVARTGGSNWRSPYLLDVCFTGFKKGIKAELIGLAEGIGLVVRSKVTVHLNLLV